MPIRRNILPLLLLGLISTNALADDLFDMLQRVSNADEKQNYQGTFILRKSDNLSTLRVTHRVDEHGVWESMDSLNGEAKKVLRHNNRVVSVFPERQLVTVRNANKQSLHPQLPENISQLKLFYSMVRVGDDRVANHHALVVDLLPKDQYRYGYRYWIDKETGMLLRCDLMSDDNEVIEQMMFTSLEYMTDVSSHDFDMQQFERFNQQVKEDPASALIDEAKSEWKIQRLPNGFMLTQNTMRFLQSAVIAEQNEKSLNVKQPNLQHLVYSDGLASVSVFIEKNKGSDNHLSGASSVGAVNAFGHSKGDVFVTVVGEVPRETVQLMAQSATKMP